jgi:hypothetical protein
MEESKREKNDFIIVHEDHKWTEDTLEAPKQQTPECKFQDHRKIVQCCNTNSGAHASEDSLEPAA